MKLNQRTFAAAALAGLFAAGAAVAAQNSTAAGTVISGEKEKCNGKDGCDGKEKKELSGTVVAEEKDKCSGKDGCKGKDGCDGKDKKKEGEIL